MASPAASIAVLTMPVAASAAEDAQHGWNGDRSGQRAARVETGAITAPRALTSGPNNAPRASNSAETAAPNRFSDARTTHHRVSSNGGIAALPRLTGAAIGVPIGSKTGATAARIEIDNRSERRAERVEDRSTWRNRSYTDTNRNRTYSGDRNYAYRDRDTERSKSDWNRYNSKKDYRWDRHDWRRDHRYDWRSYRDKHRHIYRAGRYYSPYSSWSYRRLSVGFYLDSLFYSNRYWISDPYYYRLPPAYGPYRWVRYYDDALLVDIYSGEVVDVIYDVFW
ncbi:MAG: RcnB family protein [Caenibius sp.]